MVWIKKFVYITVIYDGQTWLAPVPRNPIEGEVDNYGNE
jgi:hypothetical protein